MTSFIDAPVYAAVSSELDPGLDRIDPLLGAHDSVDLDERRRLRRVRRRRNIRLGEARGTLVAGREAEAAVLASYGPKSVAEPRVDREASLGDAALERCVVHDHGAS